MAENSNPKNNGGVDYERIARNFIKIERGLKEDPLNILDQLLNIAKRDATWNSVDKSTDPELVQKHYDNLVNWVRKLSEEDGQ